MIPRMSLTSTTIRSSPVLQAVFSSWTCRAVSAVSDANSPRAEVRTLKGQITLTIVAACILASCGRSPLKDRGETSSTTASGGESANTVRPLVDSTQLAPSALIASPSQAADTSTDIVGLICAPTVATLRDTITLRMETPHGEYLTVTRPDNVEFYLSYPGPRESRNFYLVPADSFAQMPTIRFRADVRSRPRIYGRDTLEPVFSKAGKYVLRIGHKLESERASEIHTCTIRFVANKP